MTSGIEVRMDYPMAEDMCTAFTDAAKSVNEIETTIKQIVSQLRDNVLVGETGEAICDVLEKDLCRVLQDIENKMTELSGDVATAIRYLRDGDREAASRFA